MSHESPELPEGVTLPQRYKHRPEARKWFIEGARDGWANRAFAHDDEQAFLRQHGHDALMAYAEGYNEGSAARNDEP